MGLKSVLHERFLDFGDKTSIAGLNNAVHSKSSGKYELLKEWVANIWPPLFANLVHIWPILDEIAPFSKIQIQNNT